MGTGEKGWIVTEKGATYYGFYFRFNIHTIHGLEPDEWFLSAKDMGIDCVKLESKVLKECQEQAIKVLWKMAGSFKEDIVKANRSLVRTPERKAVCGECENTGCELCKDRT
jgi:hypothetical protein